MSEKEWKKDEPLKFIANVVAKAGQPLATVWNELLKIETNLRISQGVPEDMDVPVSIDISDNTSVDITCLVEILDKSLKILGMATSQIVQKRRWDLKYKLAPDCKDLAKKSQPFTSFVFGDNIKASAFENRKERAISYRITQGKSGVMNELKSFLDQQKSRRGQGFDSRWWFRGSSQFRNNFRGRDNNYQNQNPQNSQNYQSQYNSNQSPRGQPSTRGRSRGHGRC